MPVTATNKRTGFQVNAGKLLAVNGLDVNGLFAISHL
jgi:hypothetical protein